MHDEFISLLDLSLRTGNINRKRPRLISRKKFIHKVEKDFKTTGLKPKHVPVLLSDGLITTVSLCDIEYTIICLLPDDALMEDENIAAGYGLFTADMEKIAKKTKDIVMCIQEMHGNQHGKITVGPKEITCSCQ